MRGKDFGLLAASLLLPPAALAMFWLRVASEIAEREERVASKITELEERVASKIAELEERVISCERKANQKSKPHGDKHDVTRRNVARVGLFVYLWKSYVERNKDKPQPKHLEEMYVGLNRARHKIAHEPSFLPSKKLLSDLILYIEETDSKRAKNASGVYDAVMKL